MPIKQITKKILKTIHRPAKESRKGDNGRLLIIAGSKKYHGAFYLCAAMASKMVDFVYVYTTLENFSLIKNLRSKLAEFIYIDQKDLLATIEEAECILIGPGLMPDKKTGQLVNNLLKKYPQKKMVLDAGALRVVKPELLNKNCVITPHHQEFSSMFNRPFSLAQALAISKTCPAVIVIKGSIDYVIQNGQAYSNSTGNAGMTKGGTGDVLAGLLSALCAKSDPFLAARQAIYINGLAGDKLKEKFGLFYSASELIIQAQIILSKI